MPHKDPEARREYMRHYNAQNRDKLHKDRKEWEARNRDKLKSYKQRWHSKQWEQDPAAMREKNRRAWLARRYGLTIEEYRALTEAHDHQCAICDQRASAEKPLHIDHNHETGVIRGLLCGHCNRALGLFRDKPSLLIRAHDYLEKNEK